MTFNVEEELNKILQEEIDNEILKSISEGEVHHTQSGAIVFGEMTDDEKKAWRVI